MHPENIMPLQWTTEDLDDVSFTAYLCIDQAMDDEQISDLIYQCRKGHTGVEMVRNYDGKTYVNIVVHNRKQIAKIIRDLRMHFGFPRITRLEQSLNIAETSKAS